MDTPLHIVTCAKCSQQLIVGRAVTNARLRCTCCGEVFVGSSQATQQADQGDSAESPANVPESPPASPGPTHLQGGFVAPPEFVQGRQAVQRRASSPADADNAKDVQAGRLRHKNRGRRWPMVMVVILVLAMAPLVGGIYYLTTHRRLVQKDSQGNVVLDAWMTNREADALAEKMAQSPATQPANAQPPTQPAKPVPPLDDEAAPAQPPVIEDAKDPTG